MRAEGAEQVRASERLSDLHKVSIDRLLAA